MLRIFIALIFTLTANANAMVSFNLENTPFISSLKVEDNLMLIQDKKQDFIILYNKKNEMAYIKHKNLAKTYKIAVSKVRESKFLTMVKPEKTELNLINFNSQLFSVKFGGRECLQIYGAKDLDLNSGASSAFNLYKTFVYFTGQLQLPAKCQNMYIAKSFDEKIGFPLAVFQNGNQIKVSSMINEKLSMKEFLAQNKLNTKKAIKPTLDLQYELILSLLPEKQQKTFLQTSSEKPISIKIKAIDNLLQENR